MSLVLLIPLAMMFGCSGSDGSPGASGSSKGTISGVVTNSMTGSPVSGVKVTLDPAIEGVDITTDENGKFSAAIPIGSYTFTFAKNNFKSSTASSSIVAEVVTTKNISLVPTGAVAFSTGGPYQGSVGGSVNVSASVEIMDGSTLQSVSWEQSNSVTVTITGADTLTPTVTLPGLLAYKDELIKVLEEPPISESQLPENVELPEGGFVGGLQARFGVVGVNPFALEEAGKVTLTIKATTTSGTYSDEVEIDASLPWKASTGLANVPIDVPIIINGKKQTAYNWTLTPPAGSSVTLDDATTRNPMFTPDISGKYILTVTDESTASAVTVNIYAGLWAGAITGQNASGRPESLRCTSCHSGVLAPDKFTSWRETGHAEIFTDNLNTSTHYGESCFPCHTVGYNTDANNNGIDDTTDWSSFLASGMLNNPSPNNWTNMLYSYRESARRANIQCENCHGPNDDSGVHPNFSGGSPERISVSAEVCGSCHGEPLRHARFQQWQLSKHSNYELAMDEGGNSNCSRCHTANGFLTWLPILMDNDPTTDPTANITVTWKTDETHPQTCATCHEPHSIGTVSGNDTNATVRISGNTPPLIAGFQVYGVGKGAICMTCHNTRRGLRNDSNFDTLSDPDTAPHGGAQTDILMGQNAFLIGDQVGQRGNHSLVENACVNCHMEKTPPPDLLSYDQTGTNHTFAPSPEICSKCHGEGVTAEGVQDSFNASLAVLKALLEAKIGAFFQTQINAGNTISLNGEFNITSVSDYSKIEIGESHGKQAVTVTFSNGAVLGPYALGSINVLNSGGVSQGSLVQLADKTIAKAGWNWWLLNNDGSEGVHNPSFTSRVLKASIDALVAVP